MHIIKKHLF